MKKKQLGRTLIALALVGLVAGVTPAMADKDKIVGGLVDDLGITEDQAVGGTQALLDVAKGNLGEEKFDQLLSGDAGLADLLEGDGKPKDKLKGAKSKLKGVKGEGGLAALASDPDLIQKFTDLGLDAGKIEGFVNSLLDIVGGGDMGSAKTKLLREGLGIL